MNYIEIHGSMVGSTPDKGMTGLESDYSYSVFNNEYLFYEKLHDICAAVSKADYCAQKNGESINNLKKILQPHLNDFVALCE